MGGIELNFIAILLLVSAAVIQTTDAACEKSPVKQMMKYNNIFQCPGAQFCLGQLGQSGGKVCSYCGCNKRNECYMKGNRPACNCANSAGYYGDYCECKPKSTDCGVDLWAFYKNCAEFSQTGFNLIENLQLKVGNGFDYIYRTESHYDDCKAKCNELNCRFYTFGQDMCNIYQAEFPGGVGDLVGRAKYNSGHNLYIRNCVTCTI